MDEAALVLGVLRDKVEPYAPESRLLLTPLLEAFAQVESTTVSTGSAQGS